MMVTSRLLVLRSLAYYWRTNAAVIAGVAVAVSVLGGALVTGDSVRGTLRDLALQRLGATDFVVASPGWFREALATALAQAPGFRAEFNAVAPLASAPGTATAQATGRRAGDVLVYGVDDRFWRFHGVSAAAGPAEREAYLSPALAQETGVARGDAILVRVQRPSDVPLESLHGRKDDVGRTLRLTVARVLAPDELGEFSVQPTQGSVRAVFVPLSRLQTELEVEDRVNTLLVSASGGEPQDVEFFLKESILAEDAGLRVRPLPDRNAVTIESDAGLIDAAQLAAIEAAVETTLLDPEPVLTYLANTIQVGERSIPYSLVTAIDLDAVRPDDERPVGTADDSAMVLNDWAARELQAQVGDPVRIEYYLWEEPGRLVTREAEFQLAAIVPVRAVDQDYVPPYRGISDAPTLDAWDPPFPIDLSRIRPADEAYWDQYRTAPKAFVPLEAGQRLWGSRFGSLTSVRFDVLEGQPVDRTSRDFRVRLDSKIDPQTFGIAVSDARSSALAASEGATDFGEYFLYFSFFLVVSALVLAALFFKLGVEQRVREIGLLRAVGIEARTIRRLLTAEALGLSLVGALIGAAGAVGYAWLVIVGLRTIWIDAVGTTALTLHVSPGSLVAGGIGGMLAATACTWWTLRGLGTISERSLLAGTTVGAENAPRSWVPPALAAAVCAAFGLLLALLGALEVVSAAAGFFGAGVLMLVAGLFAFAHVYRVRPRRVLAGRGWRPIAQLGLRNAAERPGRSVLAIGVIASAAFLLISVDAFRRGSHVEDDIHSGVGGYDLVVESLLPVAQDLDSSEARLDLNLAELEGSTIAAFRLRPGDDASCLNLYVPQSPRILGATARFIGEGRFAFRDSLAETDDERANPWRLLQQPLGDDVVPVAADATSMTYVLKRQLGEDIVIDVGGRPVRLRLVAALADSLFQRELVMAEDQFRRLFPDREGYQVWLIDAPAGTAPALSDAIENALADHGADVASTAARLAEFHRVENTYLSTFQTLGGLGLLLGTLGLGAVLLRNALERRRELALLGAVGYRRRHFVLMLAAESASLLLGGLVVGGLAAALAVAPALADRGARVPLSTTGSVLLVLVFVAGLLSTIVAARLATRGPLLQALRSE